MVDKILCKENKHILVISQYFFPEQFRINDMCIEWVKRGYKVTVLTGIPNYPSGVFYEGYGYDSKRDEMWNGVKVIRLPIKPRKQGALNLIKNYLSFVVEGYKWVKINDISADFVYTYEVSPMTQALVGVWYAKKNNIPHYLYVTDLWPENVEIITGIKNKLIIYPIQIMVDYIYRNSSKILTSSQSFISKIMERGINKEKLEFWPQYAESFYKPLPKLNIQSEKFNVVFAGNIGYAQGLGILIDVAQKLKYKNIENVVFTIIGNGRYKNELIRDINLRKLDNYFYFIDQKPAEEIPELFRNADALLISLSKSEVFSITIPAKTQSCMACGKPILVSADGEIQSIIQNANAGLVSNAEDPEGLFNNILILLHLDENSLSQFGLNALKYSEDKFNKNALLNRLDEIFKQVK